MLRRLAAVASLAVAAVSAVPRTAPAAEPSGAFVMKLGSDTLAIERFERSGGGLQATLLFRITRTVTHWRTSLATDGSVAHMEADFGNAADPAGTPPQQSVKLEFAGDSVFAELAPGGPQRFATRRGAMPFVNPSVVLVAEFATRTMPAPGGSVTGSLFLLSGGGTVEAKVTRPAADSVVVAFAGISFCFRLDAQGDVVSGRVPEQNLVIERVASLPPGLLSLPAPDYSAPAGAPYTAEEVKITARDGHVLAGTLTRPVRSATVPCVVTITGSGQQDRDETISLVPGYRPFREVADALARRGIAVLRMDDRGVGGSGGKVRGATSEDFAQDIEDALAWLRARPDIDGARLALLGHSEGGIIAPMIAARDPKLRAIALLAAPAWDGRRILEYQNGRAIDRHVAEAARDSAKRAARSEVDSLAARDPWLAFFIAHDPLETIRRVKVPVLLLQGETDRQVTAPQAKELADALARAGNRDVTVKVFPARNHLFLPDADGDPGGYAKLTAREMGPVVLDPLAEWLAKRLK
jgi:uncharacterized protein